MKPIKLDQHIHSSVDWDDIIIEKIKAQRLDFAVITDLDSINEGLQQKIQQNWIWGCYWVEMPVLWPEGSEIHLLLYTKKRFWKWILDILDGNIEYRKMILRRKMQSLNESFFEIDEECFFSSVRAKSWESYRFGRYDLARYIFSIAKHRNKVFEILWREISAEDFWEQFLEDYDENPECDSRFHWQELPRLQDITRNVDSRCTVISLAHPHLLFKNTQEFRRRIWLYLDLGINGLEISSCAHKTWEHEIINANKAHWAILTFWSDYHSESELNEGNHWDIWQLNPELNNKIILENYKEFISVINS
ncbi:MAG: hypothetical protein ACD_2C00111G0005 [uncultured bacterium (gcode 4)]|uniref:PHP protein n=1 Tax=uncultured bacterium (gcode 4) TaxID=1234023 RepID=K2GH35_9BACT|nr:MAG: hypothetical protein ACD_2C00111G0005 [uncultured bacterium (gcode 4)]